MAHVESGYFLQKGLPHVLNFPNVRFLMTEKLNQGPTPQFAIITMKRSIRQSNSVELLSSYSEEMKFLPEESLTGIMRLRGRHERMRTKPKLDRARADWSQLPSVTGSFIRRSVCASPVWVWGQHV